MAEKTILLSGICKVCGCSQYNPCYHPQYGFCWWADRKATICSHCKKRKIRNSPLTQHCANYRSPIQFGGNYEKVSK